MSDVWGGGESSSGTNPLSSNLYEDEEHPWGAPPTALSSTTNANTAAGIDNGSRAEGGAETQSSNDLTDREALMGGFGNPNSNAYNTDLDAGFASDPYIASPFGRQSSYNNGNNNGGLGAGRGLQSVGTSSRTAEQDDLFGGRQRNDEGFSSGTFGENGNQIGSANPPYGTEQQHGFGASAGNGFSSPRGPPRSAPAFGQPGSSDPAGYAKPVPQPSSAFHQRTFQSHNPSSVMPNSGPLGGNAGQDGYGTQPNGPAHLTPGYPMPQSYSTPTNYSPFARVENTRKESVEDMYGVPENFLEVEVRNPMTHGKYRKTKKLYRRFNALLITNHAILLSIYSRLREKDVYGL